MVHHPDSCSQNSRYLHSAGSNRIDFAEGVRLFFPYSSKKLLLNHQRPLANDSALADGPMTCSVHCHTACYGFTSEHFGRQQLLYMKHNMPARPFPVCHTHTDGGINVALATQF